MQPNVKKLIAMLGLAMHSRIQEALSRVVRLNDYRILNDYLLKMSFCRDIPSMIFEAAQCLKSLFNYELFSFALKYNSKLEIWIDPRYLAKSAFIDQIRTEMNCQDFDCNVHTFSKEPKAGHVEEAAAQQEILSFPVRGGEQAARLFLLPGTVMLRHHEEMISTIVRLLDSLIANHLEKMDLAVSASTDPLTGCYNRRSFDDMISRECSRAARYGNRLSLLMIDVDHFKMINDSFGHQSGDDVLCRIAGLLRGGLRRSDYLVRYGGEEFVIVLPEISRDNALLVAERLRHAVEEAEIASRGRRISVTVSIGVAEYRAGAPEQEFIEEADRMLYRAKNAGRNRVCTTFIKRALAAQTASSEGS